jgi:hypothetical protein
VFVVILWLSFVYIYVVLFYTCRPDTQDTDSDDSDDGRLVIDVTSEAGGENTPMPSCSSVSGGESDVGLPTGDGVFSPFSPVPSRAGESCYSPSSMMATPHGGMAMYTIDEELQRLQELDTDELVEEIGDLCGDATPCISLQASSGPASWTEGSDCGSTASGGSCGVVDVNSRGEDNGAGGVVMSEDARVINERPQVNNVVDRRIVVLRGSGGAVGKASRSPDRRADPRQLELEMTMLDARGQMPTRKRKFIYMVVRV